ncbi:PrpF family protein [Enterobacter sp. MF024]|uniref:PrpF domain-containing protein n=1 Tax=Enterobacter sp. MF024 TaxID=2555644 RepID=UPI001106B893|nr:PrpF domain-containing protein [Enterobacter sp. MF024]TLU70229.1 PrpF family protein [Enterobacter sp. MF024]
MTFRTNTVPATYVRGGTSRAIIFRRNDLPDDETLWKPIFQSVIGSPDPDATQLDGMGGGITSLSKIAVVSQSIRQDADVDYFFFQIDPLTGDLLTDANCGNISSAIGPFACEQGWIDICNGVRTVNIYNVNTNKIIVSEFNPEAEEHELVAISGVPGKHFPVRLSFLEPAGSMSRGLFPTGNKSDAIAFDDGREIQATLLDVTVPCVIISAKDAGIQGNEDYRTLLGDRHYTDRMAELRIKASLLMKLCHTENDARFIKTNVPDVIVIAPPEDGLSGVRARYVSCDRPHRAAPVTSSMALAAAVCIEGTVASEIGTLERKGEVLIHHPSGTLAVHAEINSVGDVLRTSVIRTMRTIMRGELLLARTIKQL